MKITQQRPFSLRPTLVALLVSLVSCGLVFGEALAGSSRWQIRINGMVCSFCARGIQTKLQAIPGVSNIQIDMKAKTVRLITNASFSGNSQTLSTAVRDAGYVVQSIVQTAEPEPR